MSKTRRIKTYSELISLPTYEERFNYLQEAGTVGEETFGFDRYLNQGFYSSKEWKQFRHSIIIRDGACDLALPGHEIFDRVVIHHINPITPDDVINSKDCLMNPSNVVCVSADTHRALHYGDKRWTEKNKILERSKNDTAPWKQQGG